MKPIFNFPTVEDKYIVMGIRLSSGKIALTEKCPFCYASHIHYISGSTHAVGDGIESLGHFKANCKNHGIEIELVDGLTVNNSDGYYLVDIENLQLPDRICGKVSHLVDRNHALQAAFWFWLDTCCLVSDGVISTSDKLFADFNYCMKVTKLFQHQITIREFELILDYAGHRRSYENGLYTRGGIVQRSTDCKSADSSIEKSTFPKIWK